jgi:hypothetical protein
MCATIKTAAQNKSIAIQWTEKGGKDMCERGNTVKETTKAT